MPLRVAHIGLGPIGLAVARQVAERPNTTSVAAVDPALAGRDLAHATGLGASDVTISGDVDAALRESKPDVAVVCTASSLAKVLPLLETVLRAGVPIVSTTEELAFPHGSNADLGRRLDAVARECGAGVVGTGVNPGFVMDALPVMLSTVCHRVERVRVERVQDASSRRGPFQDKIGAGLSLEAWQARADAGTVRHVGLAESVAMIARALGWELDRISDEIAPKIAPEPVQSAHARVESGQACGIVQDGTGYANGVPVIELHMEAYLGAPASFERVRIEGEPPIDMRIEGGVPGDVATASVVVNTLPRIVAAPPGLHTMLSLPLPSFFGAEVPS